MLAVERHRTTALALEVIKPVVTEIQFNIDTVFAG